MTMPNERFYAIRNTREFLVELMDPKKTPRVPKEIRLKAYYAIKHFPGEYHMEEARRIVFISLAILVTYLVIRETLVPDQVPQVEYTFHGHEITVEELEDNE